MNAKNKKTKKKNIQRQEATVRDSALGYRVT
jgi:hypothetical protein